MWEEGQKKKHRLVLLPSYAGVVVWNAEKDLCFQFGCTKTREEKNGEIAQTPKRDREGRHPRESGFMFIARLISGSN